MNNKIYYIGEALVQSKHAGSKARQDIEQVLSSQFERFPITIKQKMRQTIYQKVRSFWGLDALLQVIKIWYISRSKTIIMQYPFSGRHRVNMILKKLVGYRDIILIIHDVDSLRGLGGALAREISLLNQAKLVVLHNLTMIKVLRDAGLRVPAISLELFDYLLPGKVMPQDRSFYGKEIVFAGNLGKSSFLRRIPRYWQIGALVPVIPNFFPSPVFHFLSFANTILLDHYGT